MTENSVLVRDVSQSNSLSNNNTKSHALVKSDRVNRSDASLGLAVLWYFFEAISHNDR